MKKLTSLAVAVSLFAMPTLALAGQPVTNFGNTGSVTLECWSEADGYGGETVYANWTLVSDGAPIWYVNGNVKFSTGDSKALNGSLFGFPNTDGTVSGQESIHFDSVISDEWGDDLFVSISGYVEVGASSGNILPTVAYCD
jgi:hypothetical protein